MEYSLIWLIWKLIPTTGLNKKVNVIATFYLTIQTFILRIVRYKLTIASYKVGIAIYKFTILRKKSESQVLRVLSRVSRNCEKNSQNIARYKLAR